MGVIQDTKDLLKVSKDISGKIIGEKRESLRVECMNGLGIYETTIYVDNKFSKWVKGLTHGTMKFNASEVYRIRTTCISPSPKIIRENVNKIEEKLILDLKPALECDLFRIEIAYKMNEDFLKRLVSWRSSPEPLRDRLKYELSAQLRNPEGLVLEYSEVEIEEFPVTASVHIMEHLDMGIPLYVKRLFSIEQKILDERNPRATMEIIRLQREKTQLLRKLGRKTSLLEKIQDLATFLTPSNFLDYIDVLEDFRLHECEEAEFFEALGMLSLPKTMNVVSRTDLNLKKPAAKGNMTYKWRQLKDDVAKLF
jgi:hypothetical protein